MAKNPTRTSRRNDRRARRSFRRRILRYLAIGGVGLLGLAIIVGLFLPSIPFGPRGAAQTTAPRNGPGTEIPDQGRGHFEVGEVPPAGYYVSVPPTSGTHSPTWERCGIFDSPIQDERQVHSLEHGYVVINHNCNDSQCPELVDELARLSVRYDEKLIVNYRPETQSTIAITAWTRLLTMEEFDEELIADFIDSYKGRIGPESNVP